MSDEAAFIEAICANPGCDTPRLVYADWLDDHPNVSCSRCGGFGSFNERIKSIGLRGDAISEPCYHCHGGCVVPAPDRAARAEFIRVQCELARTPQHLSAGVPMTQRIDTGEYGPAAVNDLVVGFSVHPIPNPRHAELCAREREIANALSPDGVNSNAVYWLGPDFPIRDGPFPRGEGPKYRRGFVESVHCSAAEWVAHGDTVRAAQPVTKVRLATWPVVDRLAEETATHRVSIIAGQTVRLPRSSAGPAERWKMAFAIRWPGITFELPA